MPELNQETLPVNVNGHILSVSHLNKVYFPEIGLTKGEVLQYYTDMAPYILPHIARSPFVMVRFPEGIHGDSFYQKECPPQAPEWVTRYNDTHSQSGLTYVVCDQLSTLIYLINLGCIEIHAWASTIDHPERPRWAVFDLDPDPPSGIQEAYQVGRWLGEILRELRIKFLVKTSGSKGIHILVPLIPQFSYAEVQRGVEGVCRFLLGQRPEACTLERSIRKREGKIYLDYLQNGRGKTMAGIYSIRPTVQGQVSTPLLWEEVVAGVDPSQFNVRNLKKRLAMVGDLSQIMKEKTDFNIILHYFT
ncbi:non-homologous end-joining DNA ligase [Desulfitobacterium sp.]|uniref:non-homologous end-joining DNA ligase n=1 Tax=Desulfitobacterium sp. TaxID=49981 RepID=UPI002C6554B2|nr:non-homologous end-joining DNA ligase [Desulfitobacterium sp.]HVJ47785.1 non-homologous end-joining DNA ligase [Desulfitobacterium sp.]